MRIISLIATTILLQAQDVGAVPVYTNGANVDRPRYDTENENGIRPTTDMWDYSPPLDPTHYPYARHNSPT